MKKDYLYQTIADKYAHQIKSGVLKAGEKLPSVRRLSQQYAVSINTAKKIFLELEANSLVQSRPQSGYFVSNVTNSRLPLPNPSQPSGTAINTEPNDLISRVYSSMGEEGLTLFSIGVPSAELLPVKQLKKEVVLAGQTLKAGGAVYESLQGNLKLRRMVAARSLHWGGQLRETDLITTAGAMGGLSLCLMALTKPGDTLALESPCYPGILQLAVSMGLKVLELATHPTTGIDIGALELALPKIKVCLFVPNFNTPLGSLMPDENKKVIVELLAKNNVPLIEDDVYGDIYFGSSRPVCCKSFDKTGNVLLCGSISKTLAPGYRVGWVAPGKYFDQIQKLKLVHSLSATSIVNEAVGNFLLSGKYDSHLRQLRRTLADNYERYAAAIAEYFPEGTKISRPMGGLTLWIEFDLQIDTITLYNYALKENISIAPGRMFTLQDQFNNCMRLCFGLPWTEELYLKIKRIGKLAHALQFSATGGQNQK